MCKYNCTYKIALYKYLNEREEQSTQIFEDNSKHFGKHGSSVLVKSKEDLKVNHSELRIEDTEIQKIGCQSGSKVSNKPLFSEVVKNKNIRTKETFQNVSSSDVGNKPLFPEMITTNMNNCQQTTFQNKQQSETIIQDDNNNTEEGICFQEIIKTLTNIFFNETTFGEKITLIFKYLMNVLKDFLLRAVSNGDTIRKVMIFFHNGQ